MHFRWVGYGKDLCVGLTTEQKDGLVLPGLDSGNRGLSQETMYLGAAAYVTKSLSFLDCKMGIRCRFSETLSVYAEHNGWHITNAPPRDAALRAVSLLPNFRRNTWPCGTELSHHHRTRAARATLLPSHPRPFPATQDHSCSLISPGASMPPCLWAYESLKLKSVSHPFPFLSHFISVVTQDPSLRRFQGCLLPNPPPLPWHSHGTVLLIYWQVIPIISY